MKFKLTSSQMNFYNQKFTLDSQIWNQGVMQIFPKVYTYQQLNNAYNKLVATHDSLRVKLVETENGIVADVKDHNHINYRFWQVETEEELMKKAQDFLNEPTDRYGLLVDCAVFQTPTTSGIMINAHHIVVDGFSAFVMSEHINNFLKDESFAPVIQKYSDYVEKEEKYKQSRRYAKSKEFWLKEFAGDPKCDIFPSPENTLDFSSSEINRTISAELFSKIKALCDENEITPASFFNAVNATYFYKTYDIEKFTIGVPVFNRTTADELNTIGLYMHLVPLVINVQEDSFIVNARKIEDSQMNLFRHQSFTQHDIKELLKENNISVNQLFDVVSDYQEFSNNSEYEMRIPYGNTLSVPIEMHLQTFGDGKYNLKVRYKTANFSEQEVQTMLNSIIAIAEDALQNPKKNIFDLEMVSPAEKRKLLNDFNDTAVDYAKDKCIHELFEAQVKKTPDEKAIIANDRTLTYAQLNSEANRIAHSLIEKGVQRGDVVAFCLERNSYVFSTIMGILKAGATYLPIDLNYPKDRKEFMLSDSKAKYCITEENIAELLSNENTENPNISVNSENICYCIYTSGSTGKPKGTLVAHRNAVNLCYDSESSMYRDVYASCQIICSMASLGFDMVIAETLVPLLNGMTIVFASESESKMPRYAKEMFERNKIDVFQSTPTKLQLFIEGGVSLDNVKKIIVGGERLEPTFFNRLQKASNAKIFNFYGPTEATVWSSFAEITDAEDIHIGKPIANTQIYIVDNHLNPTPIGVMGELCIAGDSVSSGYLNRPELTNEKFIDNPFGEGKLYRTGDLAYWREDGNIVYIGRNDFQVKIRGLRIELGEIESVLQAVEGIERAVVVVRKDKEDRQLICAFYTGKEIETKELRTVLSSMLPKYMVPHIFTHLESMPMTASGKANRNALPEIDLDNISTDTEYAAPETNEEKILVDAIEAVLDCSNTSILDSFFDLGGDSLKSIELISELEGNGYAVDVKAIFDAINIQELAKLLTEKEGKEETVTYDSVLPATAAQMRVYTSQFMKPDSAHYNIPYAFKVEELDADRLQKAINKLVERHESFRTRFENRDGQIVQIIEEKAIIRVENLTSDDVSAFNKPFDLTTAPLIRIGYYENTVMVIMHHIIADGESIHIFFKELNELYMDRELENTVQYGEFAVTDKYTEENEKYWLDIFNEDITSLDLPTDYPRGEKQSFNGTAVYDLIDIKLHEKIVNKCKELNITPYVFYMACYNILLSKYSGNEDICVGMPISGRSSKYLNTMGMFVNTVVLRTNTDGNKTISELMQEIRESSVSAIDNQNYPFNELVKKLNINAINRNPLFDVMFVYQSEQLLNILLGDKKVELLPIPLAGVKCDFNLNIVPRETDIVIMVEYCTDLYKEETIQKFINSFNRILELCLDEKTLIKDITVLSDEEKETVLNDFNETDHSYSIPDHSTIYSLFEKQAEQNKEKICVTANGKNMTYGELLNVAEALDSEIRKITNNEKSIIAVIAERSLEMYSAIYGIIRGGNAYLPIDPNYPQDRIEYILENSNAKAVVAQGKFTSLAGSTKCIDMTEFIENTPEITDSLPCCAEENDTAYVIYTSGSTGKPKGAKIAHKSAVNRIMWMHEKYPLNKDDVILQKTPYTFDVSVWELFWWGMVGASLAASKPDEHFLPAKILEETEKNKVTHLHFVPSVFDIFLTYLENNPDEIAKFNTVKYVFLSGEALTASSISRFYKMFDYDKVTLHNLYGPTECAVDVSYYDCLPNDIDPVPIGKPIYNTQLYIVDKYLKPTPIGVAGELCIGGVNVGQGYLNNPELTAEKFIDNPFGNGKLYRTGDLAYFRPDGQIIFCGRIDHQVKLNGQRIELGEIENVISNILGIDAVAVMVRNINSKDILVAFYSGVEIGNETIKEACENALPAYMVPSIITYIEKMPLNQSGKLDRKALAAVEIVEVEDNTYEAPLDKNEEFICDTFKRILGVEAVGRNSDFFDLGGTSLSIISLLSEDEFQSVSAADFIANSTPAKLAKLFGNNNVKTEYLELLWSAPKEEKVLVLFPFAGGGAEAYANFVESMKKADGHISIYFIRYLHSVEECRNAAEEIESIFIGKKLCFYSHCVGSAVAMQILNILEEKNFTVEHYIAGGSIPAKKPSKRNPWNITPDFILRNILTKAGAPFDKLAKKDVAEILKNFRLDTDFATQYFANANVKISCPVSLVINKNDIFTTQYAKAKDLWSRYCEKTCETHYINSSTHYFQSDNSDDLVKIILDAIK